MRSKWWSSAGSCRSSGPRGAETRGHRLVRRLRNTATSPDVEGMSTDEIMDLLRAEYPRGGTTSHARRFVRDPGRGRRRSAVGAMVGKPDCRGPGHGPVVINPLI